MARYDFTIQQGATFSRDIIWKVNDDPIDLSGYSARLQARPKKGSPVLYFELTTENGGIEIDGSTIKLRLEAEETDNFTFKSATYDFELESQTGVTRLLQGVITLSDEVTV